MSFQEMVDAMKKMPNKDRIDFLEYLYWEHFNMTPLTAEEKEILSDLREGYVKVVANE